MPSQVQLPTEAIRIDCEHQYSAAILNDNSLWTWGNNANGKLGVNSANDNDIPTQVESPGTLFAFMSLGSLYAAGICTAGELYTWGYGGHGNLGLGHRRSVSSPTKVDMPEAALRVACTRGQDGCKGGLNPTSGGQEGPHTLVLGVSGSMYSMGTCHKGLLGNLGSKDGAFGKPWDELVPYKIGGKVRNTSKDPPISPYAVWPPPYDAIGPQVDIVSGHIHAGSVGADGRAWAWGCGSNDGRCGVERFLNMKGEGRPPEVDLMKCYMMGPHRVGFARKTYWPHPSLRGHRVTQLATGRNHMACIAYPSGEDDSDDAP